VRACLLFLLFALGTVPRAWATTANDLCAPAADPCIVPQGKTIAVTNGSLIDLGNRALVLAAGSGTRLDAGTGDMTIMARSVTLNPGSALLARAGAVNVLTTGSVSILRAGSSRARIDVGDFNSPGIISIDAGGAIEVQGVVTAQGAGAEASSGSVGLMAAGNITVSGEVNASSGGNSIGGDVDLRSTAGDVIVSGIVDVTAGIGGGTMSLSAGGSVDTIALPLARLDAKATGSEGDGGGIDVSAGNGDVVINTGVIVTGAAIGTNTTGQEAEGPHCITGGGEH
jgi:hypothetical protein